jgi:hypothetical protein
VHNFMQLASRRIFAVLRRVGAEITKSLNPAALDLFARRGVISRAEEAEYLDYWRKRTNLTTRQRAKGSVTRRVVRSPAPAIRTNVGSAISSLRSTSI